ncbi:MAG: asparaginase [Firmicutes bacterium]|nr:asparaginase [Bacillota bacterium]
MKTDKKIVILTTGGTIAGVGEEGRTVGYAPGALSAEELISAVPQIKNIAKIEVREICSVNSDDISGKIWLKLAGTINSMSEDKDTAGFVITHGTDTLEETAYFLNMTVKTDKPVVLTGSMRPSTSVSADGSMNLYQAVCTAASDRAKGLGVLVVFGDNIFSARTVVKNSTYRLNAVCGGEYGTLGVVRDGEVFIYQKPVKVHTVDTEFDVSDIDVLPRVNIVYFAVDSDPALLEFAAGHSDGIVIAGAGAGEFSMDFKNIIENIKIPVVISSRTGGGIIVKDNLICKNTIAADDMSPQKAAVLLRLGLTKTNEKNALQAMFFKY